MDELQSIKQALSFLLEQESIRQQELQALNEKIEALNSAVTDRTNEFSQWVDERDFRDFSNKYNDKLAPYADKMSKIHQNYDLMRDTYNAYNDSDKSVSEDEFIDDTVKALDAYLEDIGIPNGTKVEVKADLDGDGETETVVDATEGESTVQGSENVPETQAQEQAPTKESIKADFLNDLDKEKAKQALISIGLKEDEADSEIESWIDEINENKFMDSINNAVDKELAKNK